MPKPSGVIKASAATSAVVRPFRISDVTAEASAQIARDQAQAKEILRQAELKAAQITADAQRIEQETREKGRKQGYQESYERGLAEGRQAGRQEAFESAAREFAQKQASLVESCRQIISAINADREAWLTAGRQDLIDLAIAIARRVAHHVGDAHREVVLANLEEAVRLVGARTEVTIAINPKDAEAARAFAKTLIDMREQWQKIHIVEESEIAPGGCRVQWGSGSVDATLETQLDRIEAELNAGRKGE